MTPPHPDESKLADLLRTWTTDAARRRVLLAYFRHCPLGTPPGSILAQPVVAEFLAAAAARRLHQPAVVFALQTVIGFWQADFLRNPKHGAAADEFMRAVEAVKRVVEVAL